MKIRMRFDIDDGKGHKKSIYGYKYKNYVISHGKRYSISGWSKVKKSKIKKPKIKRQ